VIHHLIGFIVSKTLFASLEGKGEKDLKKKGVSRKNRGHWGRGFGGLFFFKI